MRHDGKTSYEDLVALDPRWGEDTKAPDGMMAGGWRTVRPGGWVKAFAAWWQSDELLAYVGQKVWLDGSDYWRSECVAHESRRRSEGGRPFICRLRYPQNSRKK